MAATTRHRSVESPAPERAIVFGPAGYLAGYLATFAVAVVLGAAHRRYGLPGVHVEVTLLAAVVLAGAVCVGAGAALATAGFGWLFCDGFVLGRFGELHWHGAGDAERMLLFLGAAVAGIAVRLAFRQSAHRAARRAARRAAERVPR